MIISSNFVILKQKRDFFGKKGQIWVQTLVEKSTTLEIKKTLWIYKSNIFALDYFSFNFFLKNHVV